MIPVIDLFAGPGGLGEGFSALEDERGHQPFRIRLSVEKEENAHRTLSLRCFFRQFAKGGVPDDYYEHLRGVITLEQLFERWPVQASAVEQEALRQELGTPAADRVVDERISEILAETDRDPWILIGGPPCQAYSTAGRSKIRALDPNNFEQDERHFLYREYLRIIRQFRPAVFVMENVTGILSSKINGKRIISGILRDLRNPTAATDGAVAECRSPEYNVYSLVTSRGDSTELQPADFIIKCEEYGVPQARHRVIILGIRSDLRSRPGTLKKHERPIATHEVISDLPRLRSMLSKEMDSTDAWRDAILSLQDAPWVDALKDDKLRVLVKDALGRLVGDCGYGGEFVSCNSSPVPHSDWYLDDRLRGVCNHASRGHLKSDLHRYLYAACYAQLNDFSPRMRHFPVELYPKHKNVEQAVAGEMFPDRFRVQLRDHPATTITSHISKDGHYFIHYDPCQCRSMTVREAARLQTFPDNYFFEGDRTPQYKQVGNAVPPLLAKQIAEVVYSVILSEYPSSGANGQAEQRETQLEHVPDSLEEYEAGVDRPVIAASYGIPVSSPRSELARKA